MNTKEYIKKNKFELLSLIFFALSISFLTDSLSLTLIAFSLSTLISFALFYFSFRKEKTRTEEFVSLKFFSAFLQKLSEETNSYLAYQNSVHFLIGVFSVIDYHSINLDKKIPYCLGRYERYFKDILIKDQKSEALIPNYLPLLENIDEQIEKMRFHLQKAKQTKHISLALMDFSIFFVLILSILISDSFPWNNPFLYYLSIIVFLLIPATIELVYLLKMKKAKKYAE